MGHPASLLAFLGAMLLAGARDAKGPISSDASDVHARAPARGWSRAIERGASGEVTTARLASATDSGRFSLLTYDVSGLPGLRLQPDTEVNASLISPLLNHYDFAVVQQDFQAHGRLSERARHGFRSQPMRRGLGLLPDGMNWFSRFSFDWLERVRWEHCHGYADAGSDCLADKGYMFSEVTLRDGVVIDVYSLHAEQGEGLRDQRVRQQNFEQLADALRRRSRRHAVIVAGATNLSMGASIDVETLARFLSRTGLKDACRRFGCGEERSDRVLYRSSPGLELDVLGWWTDPRFVDVEGAPLSEHAPVGVELSWRLRQTPELVAERSVSKSGVAD